MPAVSQTLAETNTNKLNGKLGDLHHPERLVCRSRGFMFYTIT